MRTQRAFPPQAATVTATDKDDSKKISSQSAVESRKSNNTDGDNGNSQTDQGVTDSSSTGYSSGTGGILVLASILCNEMLNLEIELASNEGILLVPQLVVADAAELELSLEFSDDIWVVLVADQVTNIASNQ